MGAHLMDDDAAIFAGILDQLTSGLAQRMFQDLHPGALVGRAAGALVGVVPYTRQSGKWCGESHIFGGRADLRGGLFMAAHNAVLRAGPLRDFYLRLRAAGKPHHWR